MTKTITIEYTRGMELPAGATFGHSFIMRDSAGIDWITFDIKVSA